MTTPTAALRQPGSRRALGLPKPASGWRRSSWHFLSVGGLLRADRVCVLTDELRSAAACGLPRLSTALERSLTPSFYFSRAQHRAFPAPSPRHPHPALRPSPQCKCRSRVQAPAAVHHTRCSCALPFCHTGRCSPPRLPCFSAPVAPWTRLFCRLLVSTTALFRPGSLGIALGARC